MASEANVIDLQALNLREDEATTQGTLAVRYLVQKLQEAHENSGAWPYGSSFVAEPNCGAIPSTWQRTNGGRVKRRRAGEVSFQRDFSKTTIFSFVSFT